MDDSQREQQIPADPFGPLHASCVQVLHLLRAYRAAGGGLIESAVQVAALIAVNIAGGAALPPAPSTPMDAIAVERHEIFASHVRAGFTRAESMQLLLGFIGAGILLNQQQPPEDGAQ